MNANQVLQHTSGIARSTFRIAGRLGRRVVSDSVGLVARAGGLRRAAKPEMDDVTLARKVETEIFRGSRVAKSKVNVNVVDGVVWLRGEAKTPNQIRTLEQKAHAVPEVRGVENLLHLPKTPAPTRADTPRRQQRTRSSTRRPAPRRRPAGRVTGDRTDAIARDAEPSPTEHASNREGRSPAPLGASGNGESAKPSTPAAEHREPTTPRTERSEPAPGAERSEEPGFSPDPPQQSSHDEHEVGHTS